MIMSKIKTFQNFVGKLTVTYKRTSKPTVKIVNSETATNFMMKYFDKNLDNFKEIKVLHLNKNNQVINVHHASKGSFDECVFPINEIVINALLLKTDSIILFQNDPEGTITDFNKYCKDSKALKEAIKLFKINLFDSNVLTRENHVSLSKHHLL